jgi:hypothetical protein
MILLYILLLLLFIFVICGGPRLFFLSPRCPDCGCKGKEYPKGTKYPTITVWLCEYCGLEYGRPIM